jgi:transglutaminase-like putative cysteine protease
VSRRRQTLVPAAEVALCVLTVCTAAGMWRLFEDGSFFPPLAAHAVAAHVVVTVLRRRGVGLGASFAITVGAAVLVLTWLHLWSSTLVGVPTLDTLDAAGDELRRAWRTFGDTRAPAPVLPGFLLVSGAVLWVSAWLADTAAFRQWTSFEAVIPSATLFAFTSIFSADRNRPLAAVLWLGAAMAFVLLHRAARLEPSPSWLGSDARHGTRSMVQAGAALGVAALAVGAITGSRLPGADATPLVAVTPEARSSARQTVSPLVELQSRLIEQSQVELFSVITSRRSYWRLTALDIFDGDRWASRGSFGEADGPLPGPPTRGAFEPITQTIDILALEAIWLPAAFEAAEVRAEEGEVRWDEESSTLIVGPDVESSDGLSYEVVSRVFDHQAAALAAVPAGSVPDDVDERYLELPAAFPGRVSELARDIVAGAETPYAQALALQDSFRDGSFTYSLAVQPGQSTSAIESFLFENRTGYCEQFAGAYAAMARAVGLPARVAVGFTPGQPDPITPGRYVVRGENAHAWPEVYLAGIGWVGFEPTPGRGAPGAEGYTGVPEAQDAAGPSTDSAVTGAGTVPPPVDGEPGPGEEPGGGTTTTVVPGVVPPGVDGGFDAGAGAEADAGDDAGDRIVAGLALLGVAVLVVAAAGGAVAATRALRRQRRRQRASTSEDLVAVIGTEVVERVGLLGIVRRRWETDREFTRRLAGELVEPRVRRLGPILTAAAFSPAGIRDDAVQEAEAIGGLVDEAVVARTSLWRRLLAAVDPRPPERQALARSRGRRSRSSGPRIHIQPATVER